jgi:23S rRNA (guanine745-N1)-methyltransferase
LTSSGPPLSCTVRGCEAPLQRAERVFVCSNGHSYDIARAGYVNLLQPQDRRSLAAGDSRAAVDARAALIDSGIGGKLIDAVVDHAATLPLPGTPAVVAELGSGSGATLTRLAAARSIISVGIDLSTAAAARAARESARVTWVVANADRRLPLLDNSVDLILSVHARRNPVECRRVLVPGGFLLVATPAADDLIELRTAVQGEGVPRDRVAALVDEHASHFTVATRTTCREVRELDRAALLDLLRATYRGERLSESLRVQHLERLTVTLASDILLFAPRHT